MILLLPFRYHIEPSASATSNYFEDSNVANLNLQQPEPVSPDEIIEMNETETETSCTLMDIENVEQNVSTDTEEWKIDDDKRICLSKHRFNQNIDANFGNSKRHYSNQARYCSKTLLERTLKNGETKHRSWLRY